jgi:hypothetical protein
MSIAELLLIERSFPRWKVILGKASRAGKLKPNSLLDSQIIVPLDLDQTAGPATRL